MREHIGSTLQHFFAHLVGAQIFRTALQDQMMGL
jgi:hypothetical protein